MKVKEVRPGFEKEAELLLQKKEVLAAEKEAAVAEAIKKVDEEFAEREDTIISILKLITVEVEVEETVEPEEAVEPSLAETNKEVEEIPSSIQSEAISPSQLKFN